MGMLVVEGYPLGVNLPRDGIGDGLASSKGLDRVEGAGDSKGSNPRDIMWLSSDICESLPPLSVDGFGVIC